MDALVIFIMGLAAVVTPLISGKPNRVLSIVGALLMIAALAIWVTVY